MLMDHVTGNETPLEQLPRAGDGVHAQIFVSGTGLITQRRVKQVAAVIDDQHQRRGALAQDFRQLLVKAVAGRPG